jgi:lipoprotein NlpI
MERAKRQDHAGAIDDYTATINMPQVPQDVKAMALFNRALILSSDGDNPLARNDLNQVLAMVETPPDVRTEARRKLVRMERQSSRVEEEELAENLRSNRAKQERQGGNHSD